MDPRKAVWYGDSVPRLREQGAGVRLRVVCAAMPRVWRGEQKDRVAYPQEIGPVCRGIGYVFGKKNWTTQSICPKCNSRGVLDDD